MNIKSLLILVLTLLICTPQMAAVQNKKVSTQEKRKLKKLQKDQRKKERKLYTKTLHENASKALKELNFVLEAHTLYGKYGQTRNVSDNLNFISVKGKKAVVQLAFRSYGGPNGVGGITLKGKISNTKFSEDKHGNQFLDFNVMGAVLHAEVRIQLSASDNNADARVQAATTGGRLQFRGNLVPADESKVYKSGMDI